MLESAALGVTKTNAAVVSELPEECGWGINDSPPVLSSSEFSVLSCTQETRLRGRKEESDVFTCSAVSVSLWIPCFRNQQVSHRISLLCSTVLWTKDWTFEWICDTAWRGIFLDWRFIERTASVVANWQFLSTSARPSFVATVYSSAVDVDLFRMTLDIITLAARINWKSNYLNFNPRHSTLSLH